MVASPATTTALPTETTEAAVSCNQQLLHRLAGGQLQRRHRRLEGAPVHPPRRGVQQQRRCQLQPQRDAGQRQLGTCELQLYSVKYSINLLGRTSRTRVAVHFTLLWQRGCGY